MKKLFLFFLCFSGTANAQTPWGHGVSGSFSFYVSGVAAAISDSVRFRGSGATIVTASGHEVVISSTVAAKTRTFSVGLIDTVKAADVLPVVKVPFAITITEVAAYTNTGTATFQIEKRAETTPNTAGTTLLSSALVADNDQQETTSFSSAAVAADQWIVVTMSAVSGGAQRLNITIRYTVD